MHEHSIATSIVERVEGEVWRLGGGRVDAVYVRVGALSGIAEDVLRSSFDRAAEATVLQGSRLVIEDMPILIDCPICEGPRPIRGPRDFHCAECGAPAGEVVAGRELLVTALEMHS